MSGGMGCVDMRENALVFRFVLSILGKYCCGVWRSDGVERVGEAIRGLV